MLVYVLWPSSGVAVDHPVVGGGCGSGIHPR